MREKETLIGISEQFTEAVLAYLEALGVGRLVRWLSNRLS